MKQWRKRALAPLAVAAAISALLWGGRWYYKQRSAINEEIARYASGLDTRDQEISAGELKLRARLAEFASTSLAATGEEVEAELRTTLNQIISHVGLDKPRVSSGSAVPQRSPAAGLVRELPSREARGRPDFLIVPATVSGVGSYEQAVQLVALLRQQACIHRIDQVSLRPVGAKREAVEVTVAFSTAFLPDLSPKRGGESATWQPAFPETTELVRQLSARNPFKPVTPPPAASEVASAAPAPPATPAPEPLEWLVTAIVSGVDGPEVWLTEGRSGRNAVLTPTVSIEGLELVSVDGDAATVRVQGGLFVIRLGELLRDRKAVIQ